MKKRGFDYGFIRIKCQRTPESPTQSPASPYIPLLGGMGRNNWVSPHTTAPYHPSSGVPRLKGRSKLGIYNPVREGAASVSQGRSSWCGVHNTEGATHSNKKGKRDPDHATAQHLTTKQHTWSQAYLVIILYSHHFPSPSIYSPILTSQALTTPSSPVVTNISSCLPSAPLSNLLHQVT